MGTFRKFIILFWLIPCIRGSLKIICDNITLEYINKDYIDLKPGIHKINQENAVRIDFKLKVDLPETTKIHSMGFKWFNNDYRRVPFINIEKNLKEVLQMDMFGLQSLWIDRARPPVVWPVQKDVTYHIDGWTPDTSRLAMNVPLGKWKFELTETFGNKTRIFVINWFGEFA